MGLSPAQPRADGGCLNVMAAVDEQSIKACVFAALILRDSGKEPTTAAVLEVVRAAGTDSVAEATAATVVSVLEAEQACLRLRAATAPEPAKEPEPEEEVEFSAGDTFMGGDDY